MVDVVVRLEGDVAAVGRINDRSEAINADTRTSLVAVIANHQQIGTTGQYIQGTESCGHTRAIGIAGDGNGLGRHGCIGVKVNTIARSAGGTGQGDAAQRRTVGDRVPTHVRRHVGQGLTT